MHGSSAPNVRSTERIASGGWPASCSCRSGRVSSQLHHPAAICVDGARKLPGFHFDQRSVVARKYQYIASGTRRDSDPALIGLGSNSLSSQLRERGLAEPLSVSSATRRMVTLLKSLRDHSEQSESRQFDAKCPVRKYPWKLNTCRVGSRILSIHSMQSHHGELPWPVCGLPALAELPCASVVR